MNDYRSVADELRERRKGKPGELLLMTGIVLIVAAIAFVFFLRADAEKDILLKSEGVVAEAVVRNKAVRTDSYTDRKGRPKTRDLHELTLAHDINAELPYADWNSGKAFPKPKYPAQTTSTIEVGETYFDDLTVGAKTTVVRIPADYKSMKLTAQLEYETSFAIMALWYLGCAAAAAVGAAMTVMGWRKRKGSILPRSCVRGQWR